MKRHGFVLLLASLSAVGTVAAAPSCANVAALLTDDFSWAVGSGDYSDPDGGTEAGSRFCWFLNGANVFSGEVKEGILLSFEGTARGAGGEDPVATKNLAFTNGVHGLGLVLATNGVLRYATDGNLFLDEGTIEMRVALREDGDSQTYSTKWQPLFEYYVSDNEYLSVAQSQYSGALYAGGASGGQWQSAYSAAACMRGWKAGEWHHLAFTFSQSRQFMRFYVDGMLAADTNEGRYVPPAAGGGFFTVGCDRLGLVARYVIDEFRISGRAASGPELAARSQRADAPRANEIWAETTIARQGDTILYQYVPASGASTGSPGTASFTFPGIPITNVSPSSMLLQAGTSAITMRLNTTADADCRYSRGEPLPYDSMTPFNQGDGSTWHSTPLTGLDTNPSAVNTVYVRCDRSPMFLLTLKYRCLPDANPAFPRTGNLWGWDRFQDKPLQDRAAIDLWIVDYMSPADSAALRSVNPHTLVLASINAVQNHSLPDNYYLKDIYGNRIEVWPGAYRLNMTKPFVADYQAKQAARLITDSGMAYDGCFFDNAMLTQSWLKKDIHGNPFVSDYNEDGMADDPAAFDAAWKEGVLRELRTFRALMPYSIMSGHAMDIKDPDIASIFNGTSIGFDTANVFEHETDFDQAMGNYVSWCTRAAGPRVTMVESSPPDFLAYGYGYTPMKQVPADTVSFARDYAQWMRFGLAFTLMNDGYFTHEWGDTDHGQDWWYDELEINLGYPMGAARRLTPSQPGPDRIVNGGFESALASPWSFWTDTARGYTATVSRVTDTAADGSACARVDVYSAAGESWSVEFSQYNCALVSNETYELTFAAKADKDRTIQVSSRKGSPDWRSYGLSRTVYLTTQWATHTLYFTAKETADDARIQFLTGGSTGKVWIDSVRLREAGPDVYRRDFDNGTVLLNGSGRPQTVNLGGGFRRLNGSRSPRCDIILDDSDAGFSASGNWTATVVDSGEWKVDGPYYHNWGTGCRVAGPGAVDARWTLTAPETDTYTIEAWWPALPSNSWSSSVRYQVATDGIAVATAYLDQRGGGDQWRPIAALTIEAGRSVSVIASSSDGLPWVADAVRVHGDALFNDGSPVTSITLAPLDGIVLARSRLRLLVQFPNGTGGYVQMGANGGPIGYVPLIEAPTDALMKSMDGSSVLLQRGVGGEVGVLSIETKTYTMLAASAPQMVARCLDGSVVMAQSFDGGRSILYDVGTGILTPLLGPVPGWSLRARDGNVFMAQNVATESVALWDSVTGGIRDLGRLPGWRAVDYRNARVLLQQGTGGTVQTWDTVLNLGTVLAPPYPGLRAVSMEDVWPEE